MYKDKSNCRRLTKNAITEDTTTEYLNSIDKNNPPEPKQIEEELLEKLAYNFEVKHNSVANKGRKWTIPDTLSACQIAMILLYLHHIVRISCTDKLSDEKSLLYIYQADGQYKGLYQRDNRVFHKLIYQYNSAATEKDIAEVMKRLDVQAPQVLRNQDPDLVAVNNGIFDYKTKSLSPFSPDKVFLTKSMVDYVPNAVNPKITEPDGHVWDVDSWLCSLSDDPEIQNLLWEIIGAVIRPNVRWNKSAWFYSTTGNNGKGTLCQLMRNICGEASCTSISLSDFNQEFKLAELLHASAIITDENAIGSYVDNAANLKAIVTGDMILLNRKFENVITYRFHGFMVQCLNEYPKIRDRTDSFYRRQLFIPFDKCFTGQERKYIKDDYLRRPEVLQYVLHKVLHMDYYTLSEPTSCVAALEQYKKFNDPVCAFADEFLFSDGILAWDFVPMGFLYDLYKAWYSKEYPRGNCLSKIEFKRRLTELVQTNGKWELRDGVIKRPKKGMEDPEPLIDEYNLTDWMNPRCTNKDVKRKCMPVLKATYRDVLILCTATSNTPYRSVQ